MGTFDVDAWRQSRERWGVKLDGREYFARDVSAPAVVAAHLELQGASAGQERAILLKLLRLAYPWRLSMWWRGDPVDLIATLPPLAWREVIKSFFAHVTGNPVTSMTVMGRSLPTSSSPPARPAADEGYSRTL